MNPLLTPAFIAEGMNLAVKNAKRLYQDAALLYESGSFPTSVSLAALSIEESGKSALLRQLVLAKDQKELKECWKAYRSHKQKNVAWLLPDLVRSGASTLDELFPLVDPKSAHPTVLDQLKQSGFYSDCIEEKIWVDPAVIVNQAQANIILSAAKSLLSSRTHTAREIELWVAHVGPVWKQDMQSMKLGVLAWQEAMIKEGLTSDEPNAMKDFLFGSPRVEG